MLSSSLHINPDIRRLACSKTGRDVDSHEFKHPVGLCSCCPAPGKPVVIEYDLETIRNTLGKDGPARGGPPGLWRYAPLLPVHGIPDGYADDVGFTATTMCPLLSDELDIEVFVKNEGTNPSGSFKDRGLAVAVAFGHACGAQRFCLPTQGNAGVAASLFSARLGLPGCIVYMPVGYEGSIYYRSAAYFGAEVRFCGENIAASGRWMREDCGDELRSGALVDLSTFFEPGRLEGKKTMGLEIFDHFGPEHLPGTVFYPTGGGTGLVGIWKALNELVALKRIDLSRSRLPGMVAVQSRNCAPVVRSFELGLEDVEPVQSQGTIADGLDVPGAIMGHGILNTIRESNGTATAVSEEEILKAFIECGRMGLPVSYESAALVAALRNLRASGKTPKGERVLLLMTATHMIPLAQANS